jgi:DNA-binding NarL/FixJ family response regulator
MAVRVLLGDDSDLFLLGTAAALDQAGHLVTGQTQEADALITLAASEQPDVIFLGDPFDSTAAAMLIPCLRTASPRSRILVVGATYNGLVIRDLLAGGADGYLYRLDGLRDCVSEAVRCLLRGYPYLSLSANAEYLMALRSPLRDWKLDDESRQVLCLLASGCTAKQIAAQMRLSVRRVYWITEKLRGRFDAATNEQLLVRAAAEGFAIPEG